jgi:hypothetical protein
MAVQWNLHQILDSTPDTFYYDEVDNGLLRILITIQGPVPMEMGDIIFSEETSDYRNILEFRFGREYFSQNRENLRVRPMLPPEIERHAKLFAQALRDHPHGAILQEIYDGKQDSKAYYRILRLD